MRIYRRVIFAAIALLRLSSLALAASSERVQKSTPAELFHWRDWVLFDKSDRLCPTLYNEGGTFEQKRIVSLPLKPGSQEVLLEWHQPSSARMRVRSPALNLGEQAMNANVSFNMPAVLFWSYLIVMVLAALALARTRFPPLKYASWLLLSVGLTQVSIVAALIVVGWFFALAWRETSLDDAGWFKFNGVQLLQPQQHLEEAAAA